MDCRTAGGSSLVLKDRADAADDTVVWKWSEGEAVVLAELGDPLATSGWALCVYAGAPASLVLEVEAPAGAVGWKSVGAKGFRYLQRALVPNGVRKVTLKPSASRKAKVSFAAKGAELALPAPPLALPITAQVGSRDVPLCVTASYGAGSVTRNEPGTVKARD